VLLLEIDGRVPSQLQNDGFQMQMKENLAFPMLDLMDWSNNPSKH